MPASHTSSHIHIYSCTYQTALAAGFVLESDFTTMSCDNILYAVLLKISMLIILT